MNKRIELRNRVYAKYGGRCAYCGREIKYKDMQIDHETSKAHAKYYINLFKQEQQFNPDSFDNLQPSCRSCNHYKRDRDLEGFRDLITTVHKRIAKLYIVNVGINFDIVKIKPFEGKFYFETLNRKGNTFTV